MNSGGGVLSAAWSEEIRLSDCGTVTSTAEAPTVVCHILTASQPCWILVGSAMDSSMLYERGSYTVSKWANACWKHGKNIPVT